MNPRCLPRLVTPRYKLFVAAFSVALLGAVASPALRSSPEDSFPLSDYPMFSHGRPDSILRITHALGVEEEGRASPLPPLLSSGHREVLQSMMTLHMGVQQGAPGFCAEVADRVAENDAHAKVRSVRLATSSYDALRYFAGEEAPLASETHAECPVPR